MSKQMWCPSDTEQSIHHYSIDLWDIPHQLSAPKQRVFLIRPAVKLLSLFCPLSHLMLSSFLRQKCSERVINSPAEPIFWLVRYVMFCGYKDPKAGEWEAGVIQQRFFNEEQIKSETSNRHITDQQRRAQRQENM